MLLLYPIVEGRCSCGNPSCHAAGKHPRPYGDYKKGDPHGIETGNGLLVLDIDTKKENGFKSLDGRELPDTYTVKTPTGGEHRYYSYDPQISVGNRVGFLPGCDIRADGGFVVGPGSPHKNGGTYSVSKDLPRAPVPQWLLDLARKTTQDQDIPIPISKDDPLYETYIQRCIIDLQNFPPAVEGDGGDTQLFMAAQIPVRKYCLPLDVSLAILEEIYNPRCEPPWTDNKTIQRKVQEAALKGARGIGTGDWLNKLVNREPPDTVNLPGGSHEYSFEIGSPASPQRMPLCTSDIANRLLTDPVWEGVWQYDEFREWTRAIRPPMPLDAETIGFTRADALLVLNWFENNGAKTGKDSVQDACTMASKHNTFHPVKRYLDSLPPATTSHLDTLASKVLGNDTPLAQTMVRLTLVAAVRRILKPGCQVDTVLTLYGGQGVGKSTFCQILFGEFFRSQMPDLSSKDSSAALKGYWGVELAELDRVLRTESSTVRDFLTRTHDDYRPTYGISEVHKARQCVFIGTTNVSDFLRDPTGNRRYWPLEVGQINTQWLKEHRDEVWAEALKIARTSEPHHFNYEIEAEVEKIREDFKQVDPWTDTVLEALKGRDFLQSIEQQLYVTRLGGEIGRITQNDRRRLADILRGLGCKTKVKRVGGVLKKGWSIPEHITNDTPSGTEQRLRRDEATIDRIPLS